MRQRDAGCAHLKEDGHPEPPPEDASVEAAPSAVGLEAVVGLSARKDVKAAANAVGLEAVVELDVDADVGAAGQQLDSALLKE